MHHLNLVTAGLIIVDLDIVEETVRKAVQQHDNAAKVRSASNAP